jgi:hypothetical protein
MRLQRSTAAQTQRRRRFCRWESGWPSDSDDGPPPLKQCPDSFSDESDGGAPPNSPPTSGSNRSSPPKSPLAALPCLPVGRCRASPPAAAAAAPSAPAAQARVKRRSARSHALAVLAALDGDSDSPALESFSGNDSSSSSSDSDAPPPLCDSPKCTHALYFASGFTAALFHFIFVFTSRPL